MYLENVVVDAIDPRSLGRFWEAALGAQQLTDEPDAYETRVAVEGGPVLDICFQPVPEAPTEPLRLHLDLAGGGQQAQVVERLLGLGAQHLDIGQGDVPWVVLGDPEGNAFCVLEDRPSYAGSGPIAALPLDSAEPARDAAFWSWLTGWMPGTDAPLELRHPSGLGPLLELCPEPAPKPAGAKNRWHLDVRLEPGDDADAIAASIAERGCREVTPEGSPLPWRTYQDLSGNEFCVLRSRS